MAKRHNETCSDWASLLLRLEELILANSGENAFEELFKLLLVKFISETDRAEASPFDAACHPEEVLRRANRLLALADRRWPTLVNERFFRLRDDHLAICSALLGRQTICGTDYDVLDAAFEHMIAKASKGSKGQFFTPRHVVEFCVRLVDPKPGELICDPACGSGAFLMHAAKHTGEVKAGEQSTTPLFWGFDFDGRAIRVAKALSTFSGIQASRFLELNSLLRSHTPSLFARSTSHDDVLTIEDATGRWKRVRENGGFDVILANPPFAGEIKEAALLHDYTLGRGETKIERDVLFTERCIELLKPGGRMAIVLPHNKFAGASYVTLRRWLLERFAVKAVVSLGRSTFLPHTHQKTSILYGVKRDTVQRDLKPERITFAISDRAGKDGRGEFIMREGVTKNDSVWISVDHDFEQIVRTIKLSEQEN
ncbi:HsdM family class I SAM-dependent methyltransferase [Terriglobus aquaticus]|uniref:Class I SAM-dependent DNA methyltransferase n=1 Tax=Terriglobus aquaticus TaxID=940139 RepID=A0ABW9KPM6_9BACT|nr:N-6 DNA methylase [Terriglobus aquaticus]